MERPRASATLAAALSLAAFVCSSSALPSYAQPRVEDVELVGAFSTNAWAWGRDGGYSARVADRILWLFGDTFTPSGMRCATAGWSSPRQPFHLREEVDARGAPFQLYRFSADERAFNQAHAHPPECCAAFERCPKKQPYCTCRDETDCRARIALWPGDAAAGDGVSAVGFYEKVVAGVAPYDFQHVGTGVARVALGRTTAARTTDRVGKPLLVFSHPEPNFLRAVAVKDGARRVLYAYAAVRGIECTVDVLVARMPIERISDRSAYRFWNGGEWVGRLEEARPILSGIAGGLGSVVWNDHLRAYVSSFADICTGGKLHVRVAPRPEGPWSDPAIVDLGALGATVESYAANLHPALGGGAEMWFSFYRPEGRLPGELRIGKIRFR